MDLKDKLFAIWREYESKRNVACSESDIYERESIMNQTLADLLSEISKLSR